MEERVPPQNIEAEQSVLGAMLVDREAISKVSEILMAEDFYREAHKVIYSLMLELFNKNEAVDYIEYVLKNPTAADDLLENYPDVVQMFDMLDLFYANKRLYHRLLLR